MKDGRQRELVGTRVDLIGSAERLFWSHISRRTHQGCVSHNRTIVTSHNLGDSEVEYLYEVGFTSVFIQENISWLQISMNHTGIVRSLQPFANLGADIQRNRDGERPCSLQKGREGLPFQILHDEIGLSVGSIIPIKCIDDVRITQLRQYLSFSPQAFGKIMTDGGLDVE